MGPHGLVASYLYRAPLPDAGQADRRAVRPLDGRRGRPAARPPGTRAQAGRRAARTTTCRSPTASSPPSFTWVPAPPRGLAVLYGVDRSTITRAVGEIRPLLAARGFAVPGEAGVRLRTLADVFAYAAARGGHDAAGRRGRRAGPPQGQSPARGAPDPVPRSGADLIFSRKDYSAARCVEFLS